MFVAPRRKHYYSMVPANGGLALPAPLPPTATSPAPASPPPLSSSSLPLPRPGLEPSSPKNMHAHARRETRPYARVILSSSPLSPPLHARSLELSASTRLAHAARTHARSTHARSTLARASEHDTHTCSSKSACSVLLLSSAFLSSASFCFLAAAAAADKASASLSFLSCSSFASRVFFSCA